MNVNLDRFSEDQHVDTVSCANCGAQTPVNEAIVDDNKGLYHCDESCFYDWASGNAGEIIEEYKEMYVR